MLSESEVREMAGNAVDTDEFPRPVPAWPRRPQVGRGYGRGVGCIRRRGTS